MLVSVAAEPWAYFSVTPPITDGSGLFVYAHDSVMQYRVEQGRRERLAHGEGHYAAQATPMDHAQYRALTALAMEAKAWCDARFDGDSADVVAVLDRVVPTMESQYRHLRSHEWTWHTIDSVTVRVRMEQVIEDDFTRMAMDRTYTFRQMPYAVRQMSSGWAVVHVSTDRGLGLWGEPRMWVADSVAVFRAVALHFVARFPDGFQTRRRTRTDAHSQSDAVDHARPGYGGWMWRRSATTH